MKNLPVATLAFSLAFMGASSALSAPVTHQVATVNGVKVDKYTWKDSQNRPRSVSLKQEGQGNPGHGGYAVQMTYQVKSGATWQTITVNAAAGNDGGFGYFVSHERYRNFIGSPANFTDTIAHKVFGKDDSPLSLQFPVVGSKPAVQNPNAAAHRFTFEYPRYGTVMSIPKGANGEDVSPTPVNQAKLQLYKLPVTVTWVFQNGFDYPRIATKVSFDQVPGPDRVNFDLRGPYGVMRFDNNGNSVISRVIWGDRFHFRSTTAKLTRNSAWTWNQKNNGARYNALIAGGFEMGLVEPKTFASSKLVDGYSDGRGKTSATYNGGNGCPSQTQLVPCDWEWPYQSAQYSLSYDDPDARTNFKKMAWGSAPFWGTGPSLKQVYDSPTSFKAFNGFPGNRQIAYDICVVLGKTVGTGLTRAVAAGPAYNCATVAVP